MHKLYRSIILGLFMSLASMSFGQGLVNVSPTTGAAGINIPLYTVVSGSVSVPISVYYAGSGIKTMDAEGSAGIGWQVNAGGQISRMVRGLPDDCTKDNAGTALLGWMNSANPAPSYISAVTLQNNGSNCTYGANDISTINANIAYTDDTEPDQFYVSAPGLSATLVYSRGGGFKSVGYQQLQISYTTVGGSGNNANSITSFTITNSNGLKYVFSAAESTTEKTVAGTVNYFGNKYNQYKNGITYYSSWKLTSVKDINGNGVSFAYLTEPARNGRDSTELALGGSTSATLQFIDQTAVTPQVVTGISTFNNNGSTALFSIAWNPPGQVSATGAIVIQYISGLGHNFQFSYSSVHFNPSSYTRAFLTGLVDQGCATPVSYQFSYNGVNTSAGTTILGDSTATSDYWGYWNETGTSLLPQEFVSPANSSYPRYLINCGQAMGTSYAYTIGSSSARSPNASAIVAGSLTKISYADGGSSSIVYEPNDYYDAPSGTVVQGGGIRVKQVIDSAGTGSANPIVRNYSYLNPTGTTNAGLSSGAPVSLPQYAFTIPYSGAATGQTLWQDASALSLFDLSNEDHTIIYAYTRVSQTGAGSSLYNNSVPATVWSTSATPVCSGCSTAEWYPTVDYAATYTCPSTSGPIANLTNAYPFIPNPNYDFERGLPISVKSYNDAGYQVSETDYTYQRSFSPSAIIAFKAEDGPAGSVAKFYNKYTVFYNTSELTATLTKKVYDSNNQNQAVSSTITNTYGSAYHKLVTQQSVTNSDNSTVKTYYSYINDFQPNSGATNSNINALYNLQQLNYNALVESYQTVTRGTTTVTTGATLTTYSPSVNGSVTNYLPAQQYALVQPNGAASFTPYSINTGAQTTARDPNYILKANFDSYDNTGMLQTADDGFKHYGSAILDENSNQVTATFKGAKYKGVAFQDFDSKFAPSVNTFTIGGSGSYSPTGSHAGNAAGLATTQTVTSGSITRDSTASNYIFSIWINAATAGTLTFTGMSPAKTLSYNAGGWSYYQMTIPVSALAASFTIGFTSSQNISVDDILLYPDNATAQTVTYDAIGYHKIAETNTNGISAYYINDQWGRLLYALNRDHHIVERKQYVSTADLSEFSQPVISGPATVYNHVPAQFTNSNVSNCFLSGLTYTWNFGDGTAPVVGSSPAGQGHTYTTNGTYTITVTVTSPFLGTSKSGTFTVTVANLPATRIQYTNTCTPGGKVPSAIQTVNFLQGSTVKYSFSTSQLQSGVSVAPGSYTIQIIPAGTLYNATSNPTGWTAIEYSGSTQLCYGYVNTGSTISFSDNLIYTPTMYLQIQPTACPSGGGGM